MAFSGFIKARERPCTQGEKRKTVSDRKGEKLREKETQNRGRTEGLKDEKNKRRRQREREQENRRGATEKGTNRGKRIGQEGRRNET